MTAHGLIDTTEMYLKAIIELEEEGIVPLRARIAERLNQSGPTVSQTVARMERDGLLRVEGDRHLVLSEQGRGVATHVMRKHRLAECLLADVIKLPWEDVHIEACRWEHVISEEVEARLVTLLDRPSVCPHGNPIPALDQLGVDDYQTEPFTDDTIVPMVEIAGNTPVSVRVRRIGEQLQDFPDTMRSLKSSGIFPEAEVSIVAVEDGVRVGETEFPRRIAGHIFVLKP